MGVPKTMKVMTENASDLKNELEKTRNLVRLQQMRYQQLVSIFQARLREKEEESRCDLQSKHTQLTRVLHSLYILEAKLRKEQRMLRSALEQRDVLLKSQENEIHKLKTELRKQTSIKCVCRSSLKSTKNIEENRDADNKPDLISSIAIEVLKSDNCSNSPPSYQLESEDDISMISSLNTNQLTQQSLQSQQDFKDQPTKFKSNETNSFIQTHSPRMILQEVTEIANENINAPVLKCVKQILLQDNNLNHLDSDGNSVRLPINHVNSLKPPNPPFKRPNLYTKSTSLPLSLLQSDDSQNNKKPQIVVNKPIQKPTEDIINVTKEKIMNESKIVQTVSAVLSDSAGSEDEQAEDTSPTVSQMVKKFENMKSKQRENSSMKENNNISTTTQISSKLDSTIMQTNFEEFHLVDKEIDSTCQDIAEEKIVCRLEAEGEEDVTATAVRGGDLNEKNEKIVATSLNSAKYETFLEVTGLSQKSILTPSRILSNHRNVMKPKDVKYRSRVKAAVNIISDKYSTGNAVSNASPAMKYWTEPYL